MIVEYTMLKHMIHVKIIKYYMDLIFIYHYISLYIIICHYDDYDYIIVYMYSTYKMQYKLL